MQLSDMRTRLRKTIGNPDTTDVPDADLNELINLAYRDIAGRYRFHTVRKLCQFTTVDGTERYGLPTDCEVVLRVRDVTNGTKLRKRGDRFAAVQEASDDEVTGKPTDYVRQRDWILLDPTPDDAYVMELYYKAGITDLDADTDEPILPEAWHEGILKLARHKFYDDSGDIPKATYALANYDSWLSTKPIEFDEEKKDIDQGVEIPTLKNAARATVSFDEE